MTGEASELAALLAARISDLAPELLPGGVREGAEWRCGSLAGERGRSLAVHLTGGRAGVWSDFASGERGDALDLVAAARCGGDVKAAMAWARSWLGLGGGVLPPRVAPAIPAAPGGVDDADRERRRAAALKLLGEAAPVAGTPAERYLRSRGIDLGELGEAPALRFHPMCWNRETGRTLPAMLAAISGSDGATVAVHRTYLARNDAGGWGKAPLKDAKLTLGSYAGGAVRLWRGSFDGGAPVGELAVAEGIETALSVAVACPEIPVWAAVSLANMGRIALPSWVATVTLCADNDGPGNAAAVRAFDRAIAHCQAQGRQVRVALPPGGAKDFNDVLKEARP